MRVRADPASGTRDITVPRPVVRQKSYKSLLDQASTSSGSSCASLSYLQENIEEEEAEENEMVRGGPSDGVDGRAETSQARSNGNNWVSERDEYDSDKDEDEDVPEEPVVREIGPQLPGVFDVGYRKDDLLPDSGIIVTVSPSEDVPPSSNRDNELLIQLRVREYQGNFHGFAEINRFETIEEMHEFIVNNSDSLTSGSESITAKQERYLDILLKERKEDRFRRLVETSKGTVRRVLARNEHILQKLFASASLENFPSPLGPREDVDAADDDEEDEYDSTELVAEMEENMKRWYMIEMIGIWLKLVTDVKSYREAIKKCVLKTSCGIENDRYEGIAVPLKYK